MATPEAFRIIETIIRRSTPNVPSSTLSALDIPEILERIFEFLSSPQIRCGPSRVCKSWRLVSLRFFSNTTAWDSHPPFPATTIPWTELKQQLTNTDILRCNLRHHFEGSEISAKLSNIINNLPSNALQRIRELHFVENSKLTVHFHVSMFKALQHLTTLYIIVDIPWYFHLDGFFTRFPNLQELSMGHRFHRVSSRETLGRETLDHDITGPWPATVEKLRSLTLFSLRFKPSLLDSLLKYCPKLKELKLVTIQYHYGPRNSNTYPIDEEPLEGPLALDHVKHFSRIAQHCPRLESLHFSEIDCPKSMKPLEAILVAFPNLSGCGILRDALESTPNPVTLMRPDMAAFMNQLTTLEIMNSTQMTHFTTSIAVERILCEAPNLLHFKVNDMGLKTSCFDLRSNAMAPLWACRNLQTLHIRTQSYDTSRPRDRGPRISRMFYAYLSKCCPRLRDLNIRYSDLNIKLESGLCLLSEMKDLEKLVLGTTAGHIPTDRDLDWLSTLDPREGSALEKFRRWRIVKSLKAPKLETQRDLAEKKTAFENYKSAINLSDVELRQAIWEASTIDGVAKTLETIWNQQLHGEYCWPYLDMFHLFIGSSVNAHVISKYRPILRYQEHSELKNEVDSFVGWLLDRIRWITKELVSDEDEEEENLTGQSGDRWETEEDVGDEVKDQDEDDSGHDSMDDHRQE
ncbi:hypothetical protein BGX34_004368 [Mortierella sp. NVP85]|nr:hypothetical protein BGX34_004368 [Mortierella sp. NVP85]